MKKQIIKTAVLAILATGIVFSCKKKDDSAPANTTTSTSSTTGGTTTGGTTTGGGTTGGTNGLQNNQWSINGTVYTSTASPYWEKNTAGVCYLKAETQVGDTAISIYFRMKNYLMASGTYSVVWATAALTDNVIQVGISKSVTVSPNYSFGSYVTTGGTATVSKQGGVFTISCTNVGMNNVSLSSKLVFTIPVLPPANASFTVPSGFVANKYTVGSNTFTPTQFDISKDNGNFKFEGSLSAFLKVRFSESFPTSGTYDLVSTQAALAPGKVFIEFNNFTELYNSTNSGRITVITDSSDVSVTASNITLNKILGSGSQTVSLNGNLKH
jgi:hypothetical protein